MPFGAPLGRPTTWDREERIRAIGYANKPFAFRQRSPKGNPPKGGAYIAGPAFRQYMPRGLKGPFGGTKLSDKEAGPKGQRLSDKKAPLRGGVYAQSAYCTFRCWRKSPQLSALCPSGVTKKPTLLPLWGNGTCCYY